MATTEQADYQYANELGGVELLRARYHRQNFSRHSHEGYTVGVIDTGAQRFYRSGGDHIAPQHSIILVNADDVHNGCAATEGGWSYRAMYPRPEQFEQLNLELGRSADAPYFSEPVVHDLALARQLTLTFDTLSHSDNPLLRESLMFSSLIRLMTRHGGQRPVSLTRARPQLLKVKQFLDQQCDADVSLQQLADYVGLSPFHLLRQFQREFGLAPHAYQIQARVRLAKRLIRQGLPLLQVAQECGFYDQSHLSRHFKKAIGLPPGRYAREMGKARRIK
ncbi:AraC family transcriptional regulator [Ferrimonas kyonanensis]|uniref:AraC family transcriptional regulator n=1 Tax=Ferrimonas kyonanensis TaxID=364763 RepID=UPI0004074A19|nr:AraC family transcriptional regulator [Ferrimonas kyonanensis]